MSRIGKITAIFLTVIMITLSVQIPFSASETYTGTTMLVGREFFIETFDSSQKMQVDLNGLCNVSASTVNWTNLEPQKWKLVEAAPGYYFILSVYSGECLTASSSTSGTATLSLENSQVAAFERQNWKFISQYDGSYMITTMYHEDYSMYLALDVYEVVLNSTLTTNTWYVGDVLMPTSGYELAYEPTLWNDTTCNCYAYAINNQILIPDNVAMYKQQPGEVANEHAVNQEDEVLVWPDSTDMGDMIDAVQADFDTYNLIYGTQLIFQSVGRYEACPTGTYKVALIVASDRNYHWLRQNQNGYWSHKNGLEDVSIVDDSGNLIADPQLANFSLYLQGHVYYYNFVGYYAVSPWNKFLQVDLLNINQENVSSFDMIDQVYSNTVVNAQKVSTIQEGMSYAEIADILGSTGTIVNGGAIMFVYEMNNGGALCITYAKEDGQLIARRIEVLYQTE